MPKRRLRALAGIGLAFAACLAFPVRAEVKAATPDAFQILFVERVAGTPAAIYQAVGQIERWWSGEHTYSGNASNLSFALQAGACFCERWNGSSVEHGRAILVLHDQVVRLSAALGPLQVKAINGVLTFLLKAEEGGTSLTVGYRVNGSSASALDKDAAAVDGVLGIQVQRLKRYVETGKPAP